jgi:DNA-binding beta-propeller fold protein YncE
LYEAFAIGGNCVLVKSLSTNQIDLLFDQLRRRQVKDLIYIPKLIVALLLFQLAGSSPAASEREPGPQRRLYVASPGVRDNLEWGGHGVLVFDINDGHRFVKRISLNDHGVDKAGKILNMKGICANANSGRLYVSTLKQLLCVDLVTDKVLWEKSFDLGCDRLSISPDGKVIYLPSLEQKAWYIVDAATGEETKRLVLNSKSHNTVYGLDGKRVYLAGLGSPYLSVASTDSRKVEKTVGPFGNFIRPFTVDGAQTLVFANVNGLLGFEIGDLTTNKIIHRVEVKGFPVGKPERHGCPSHGIALTPDEREVWLCDSFNSRLHIFDATVSPPKQGQSIALREQPGWITFSRDGRFAYPSTGEIIDAKSRRIVARLTDETGRPIHSEKMMEIDFSGGKPVATGDQFGLGRVVP